MLKLLRFKLNNVCACLCCFCNDSVLAHSISVCGVRYECGSFGPYSGIYLVNTIFGYTFIPCTRAWWSWCIHDTHTLTHTRACSRHNCLSYGPGIFLYFFGFTRQHGYHCHCNPCISVHMTTNKNLGFLEISKLNRAIKKTCRWLQVKIDQSMTA